MDGMTNDELMGVVRPAVADEFSCVDIREFEDEMFLNGWFTVEQLEAIVALKKRGVEWCE